MKPSDIFSIGGLIRLMLVGGLIAVMFVLLQSCQKPKTGLDQYATGTLSKLTVSEEARSLPEIVVATADGKTLNVRDLKGKVTLVNVWATWCPPCVAEMPMLNDLEKQRGDDRFQVVTISIDRRADEPAKWFGEKDIDALTPWHDGSFAFPAKTKTGAVPFTLIYDRYGVERARIFGEVDWTAPEALAFIDRMKAE